MQRAFGPSIALMFHVEHFAKTPPTPRPPFSRNTEIQRKKAFSKSPKQIFTAK
jgi:hypothetical protein